VDYQLTELGRSLWAPVEALGAWAQQNQDEIAAARQAFDARNDAG
jgi:DNA-binding HxlR family transcriptional regulator